MGGSVRGHYAGKIVVWPEKLCTWGLLGFASRVIGASVSVPGAVATGSPHAADYSKIPPDPVATAPGTDTL